MDSPIKVLLIEDDEDDYLLTRDMLNEIGSGRFELEWVQSSKAGLEAMRLGKHDVYLVDYRLDGQTGVKLLKAARVQGCRGPVILLTAHGDRDTDVQAMKAGAADYLTKGRIDAPLLERAIRYALERHRAAEALAEAPPVRGELPSRRILVVDDNVDTAAMLAQLLKYRGQNVQTANNGPAALEAAQRHEPEIVLLDIGLPGLNGYEVARQLRRLAVTASATLCALTGYGQEEDRRRSKEAGFDFHFVKPVTLKLLEKLLTNRDMLHEFALTADAE